jgi:hypothetical protein
MSAAWPAENSSFENTGTAHELLIGTKVVLPSASSLRPTV